MADAMISQLAVAGALSSTDLMELEQGEPPSNSSGKITLASLKTFFQTGIPLVFPYDTIIALGDETTVITTGSAKVTLRAPRAMTLTKVKACLSTASSSGLVTFDVKRNGVSMFSTPLTIDDGEKTSETAATPAVLSSTIIDADDELTFDITASGTSAKGPKITLVGTAS